MANLCLTSASLCYSHSFHFRWPHEGLHHSSLKEQVTKGAIYKSFLKLFYVCLGWGNSAIIVVHIVIDSLRCVEDMEFYWTNNLVYYCYYCYNCSLLLLTDRKHIFLDVSCRTLVHYSFDLYM